MNNFTNLYGRYWHRRSSDYFHSSKETSTTEICLIYLRNNPIFINDKTCVILLLRRRLRIIRTFLLRWSRKTISEWRIGAGKCGSTKWQHSLLPQRSVRAGITGCTRYRYRRRNCRHQLQHQISDAAIGRLNIFLTC